MKKIFDIRSHLMAIFNKSPEIKLDYNSKIVIFSDLHMGDGGRSDDFKYNSICFKNVLTDYYTQGYTLILNGDIEELQKDVFRRIVNKWAEIYELFDAFDREGRLFKIVGNHDSKLYQKIFGHRYTVNEGVRLTGYKYPFFVFHGHQCSPNYNRFNRVIAFFIKLFAGPLGIKNITRLYYSPRKLAIEKTLYDFSYDYKIVSIIGHTHRPLFESLSKSDLLRFKIEAEIRQYRNASTKEQKEIVERINRHKHELKKWREHNSGRDAKGLLYSTDVAVPLLFNSGCVIGRKGFSGIEISDGKISLVSWKRRSSSKKKACGNQMPAKTILRSETINYINDSISILI